MISYILCYSLISSHILFHANAYMKCQEAEELMGLAPEKVLLKWMNYHLKKAGYKKEVTNFSSDLKVYFLDSNKKCNVMKTCYCFS